VRNITLMTIGGVRYRIGYSIGGGAGLLNRVGKYDLSLHQVELNGRLIAREAAVRKEHLKPEVYLTLGERVGAWERLKRFGIEEGAKLIAVHPEAGYTSKEWGNQKFVDLIDQLLEKIESRILIFGLNHAREVAKHFSGSERVVNLVGLLSLREVIAVLNCCEGFIGNDSGLSHIAQALHIPSVVVASGTNRYEKWGIWMKESKILEHSVPCAPCHLDVCNVTGHPCMSRIQVDEVLQEVLLLGELVRI